MMKTVTVQLQALIANFSCSMTDYILMDDSDLASMEDNTETFLRDLRNLLNLKRGCAVDTLRRLFNGGYTMMMLPPEHFETLEEANAENEDFSIVVKNDKDTLCILCKNEISW